MCLQHCKKNRNSSSKKFVGDSKLKSIAHKSAGCNFIAKNDVL